MSASTIPAGLVIRGAHLSAVTRLAVVNAGHDDGAVVVSWGGDGVVRQWDARSHHELKPLLCSPSLSARTLAVADLGTGAAIALADSDGIVVVTSDASPGAPPRRLEMSRGRLPVPARALGWVGGVEPQLWAAGSDGAIRRFDRATLTQVGDLIEPAVGDIRSLITIHDPAIGWIVVVAGSGPVVAYLDASSGRTIGSVEHGWRTTVAGLCHIGTPHKSAQVATMTTDGGISLIDIQTGQSTKVRAAAGRMLPATPPMTTTNVDGVGPRLVVGRGDGNFVVYDAMTGAQAAVVDGGGHGAVAALASVDAAGQIVAGHRTGLISFHDLQDQIVVGDVIRAHPVPPRTMLFTDHADGPPTLFTAGEGGIRSWRCDTGEQLHEFAGSRASFRLAYSSSIDGHPILFSADATGRTVSRWDPQTGIELAAAPESGHRGIHDLLIVSAPGSEDILVAASDEGHVPRWDPASNTPMEPVIVDDAGASAIAAGLVSGRSVIFSGGEDGSIRRWDAYTGELLGPPARGAWEGIKDLMFVTLHSGQPVVVGLDIDNMLWRWHADSLTQLAPPIPVPCADFAYLIVEYATSPTESIATLGDDKALRLWNIATGNPATSLADAGTAAAIRLADGRKMTALAYSDGSIVVEEESQTTCPAQDAIRRGFNVN